MAVRRALLRAAAATSTMIAIGAAAYAYPSWRAGVQRRPAAAERPTTSPISGGPGPGEPLVRAEPAPRSPVASSAIEAVIRRPAASPSTAPHDDASAEVRLLERARQALARTEFSSALTALAHHERRYPAGRLAEEREALKVIALAGLGRRDEAQRVAGEFRKHFPRSVLLPRIDEMLKAP
jgi:hypothetical protein